MRFLKYSQELFSGPPNKFLSYNQHYTMLPYRIAQCNNPLPPRFRFLPSLVRTRPLRYWVGVITIKTMEVTCNLLTNSICSRRHVSKTKLAFFCIYIFLLQVLAKWLKAWPIHNFDILQGHYFPGLCWMWVGKLPHKPFPYSQMDRNGRYSIFCLRWVNWTILFLQRLHLKQWIYIRQKKV